LTKRGGQIDKAPQLRLLLVIAFSFMADNNPIPTPTPRPRPPQAQDKVGRFFDYDPDRYKIGLQHFFSLS
jgi:hypothetical protein